MKEEIGSFGKTTDFPYYDLDEETRDRLLAHSRQDTAFAASNTSDLIRKMYRVEKMLGTIKSLLIILTLSLFVSIAMLING